MSIYVCPFIFPRAFLDLLADAASVVCTTLGTPQEKFFAEKRASISKYFHNLPKKKLDQGKSIELSLEITYKFLMEQSLFGK
jgi:hypothetical protein